MTSSSIMSTNKLMTSTSNDLSWLESHSWYFIPILTLYHSCSASGNLHYDRLLIGRDLDSQGGTPWHKHNLCHKNENITLPKTPPSLPNAWWSLRRRMRRRFRVYCTTYQRTPLSLINILCIWQSSWIQVTRYTASHTYQLTNTEPSYSPSGKGH